MSMEISGRYSQYQTDYEVRLKAEQEKTRETEKGQNKEKTSDKMSVPHDEYISSEKSGSRPTGLYRMGQDGNGNPKVLYDDPKKSGDADGNGEPGARTNSPKKGKEAEQPKVEQGSRKDDAEEATSNTDAVDREIEKLKKQKQQLVQQIGKASGDEEKTKELEKKLAQLESELSQKDNDAYRRQHAVISSRA